MSEEIWSEEDHLRHGLETVAEIEKLAEHEQIIPRTCFHLTPITLSDDEPWSDEASFCQQAKPFFEALNFKLDIDYVGGTSGIEAYDFEMPTEVWLRERVPALLDIGVKTGMLFEGWSFEPTEPEDFSYMTCGPTLEVFNSKSPEGIAAIEQLKREAAASSENN